MRKIRKEDTVIVIAGKHKGKVSEIQKVKDQKVRLKGVNVMKKAVKGQGFVEVTLPIHISNVMYYSKDENIATKIKIKREKDGTKKRVAKNEKVAID